MMFKDVKIGQQFFDPFSGEDYKKVDDYSGLMVSPNGDSFNDLSEQFEPDSIVEI